MSDTLDAETAQRIDRLIGAFRARIVRAIRRGRVVEVRAGAKVLQGGQLGRTYIERPFLDPDDPDDEGFS